MGGFKFLGFMVELETLKFQVSFLLNLTKQQGMELETRGFKFHSFYSHQTGPKKKEEKGTQTLLPRTCPNEAQA